MSGFYGNTGTAVGTVTVIDDPSGLTFGGIVGSGGFTMNKTWPEQIDAFMWGRSAQVTPAFTIHQIIISLHDEALADRLRSEWADELDHGRGVRSRLPVFTASRGPIRFVQPTPLTLTEDGRVYGHLALWPHPRWRRMHQRWRALRLTVGDHIGGRKADDDISDDDW